MKRTKKIPLKFMMTLGITVGKFYPFHLGHNYLIQTAKTQVDHLVVLVGYKLQDTISGAIRASWIRKMHPDVEVIEVLDNLPEAPEPWALKALQLLAGRQPDFAFTSELYGEPWAKAMGAIPITVDLHRQQFPISGTQLRNDLATHWSMLTPPAKSLLLINYRVEKGNREQGIRNVQIIMFGYLTLIILTNFYLYAQNSIFVNTPIFDRLFFSKN